MSRILLTRTLPTLGQSLLQRAVDAGKIELVQWKEESGAPRTWILDELNKGPVAGMIVMLTDKVRLLL